MLSIGCGSGSDQPCQMMNLPPREENARRSALSAWWMNSSVSPPYTLFSANVTSVGKRNDRKLYAGFWNTVLAKKVVYCGFGTAPMFWASSSSEVSGGPG